MKSYRCIIIDDEPLAIDVIEHYVEKVDQLELVGRFTGGIEAFSFLKSNAVDLLFLDIEMPEFTGLDLLRALDKKPQVIITTAYREYAVQGFDLNVLDYLVKPIPMDRFMRAISKFLDTASSESSSKSITIRADRKFVQLELSDILYIEGLKDYVKIVLKHGQLLTKKSLGKMGEELDGNEFLRVHKSFLVSKSAITAYSGQHVETGDSEIPVGRSYRDEFLEKMG